MMALGEDVTHVTWYRNEHELLPGPDMQVVGRYGKPCFPRVHVVQEYVLLGLDLELAPESVDILLLVVHPDVLHHMISDGRMSAISANHEVELDLNLLWSIGGRPLSPLNLKPGFALAEVGSCQLVVEVKLHIGHSFQDVQQAFVQTTTVHGEDGLERVM